MGGGSKLFGKREMAGSDAFKSSFGDMLTQNRDAGMGGPDKRGGLFGGDFNGEDFINVLTRAAALAQGDYGGAAQIGQLIAKPRRDADEREKEFADWERREQWKLDNQKPVNNDTINDFEWYKGLSPEDRALYEQMRPVYRQGPDGQFYRVEPQQPSPTFDPSEWEPYNPQQGGPTQPASGGFPGLPPRRRYR